MVVVASEPRGMDRRLKKSSTATLPFHRIKNDGVETDRLLQNTTTRDEEVDVEKYEPASRLERFYFGCCACHYSPLYDLKSVPLVFREEAPTATLEKFVQTSYRPELTFLQCIASMFWWHNETINIWSALVLAFFNVYWVKMAMDEHEAMTIDVKVVLWAHALLRAFCWLASWAFHTFMPMDDGTSKYLCIFDYIGCFVTILAFGTSTVYLNLYCHPMSLMICEVTGAILIFFAIMLSFMPAYQGEESKHIRILVSLGCVVPYVIGLFVSNYNENGLWSYAPQYTYLMYGFAFEIAAVFFYATMIPERVTNIFDVALNSHSIWHCLNMGFDYYMFAMVVTSWEQLEEDGFCQGPGGPNPLAMLKHAVGKFIQNHLPHPH